MEKMDKLIAAFTIFTLILFSISTVTIALDPITIYKPTTVSQDSQQDKTAANDQLPQSQNTQTFLVRNIDLPRTMFSRPIQRHTLDRTTRYPLRFVHRHPCRKFKKSFMIPVKRSYGNDMMVSDKTDKTVSVDLESIGDPIPSKWLEFKHEYYGHSHHKHHYHHHIDDDDELEMKYESGHHKEKKRYIDDDGVEIKFESGHHKEKKREHKDGFGLMKGIRKFLKHTFD